MLVGTNPRTGFPFDPVNAINPRAANSYGHIVSWSYLNDFSEPDFRWDIFALGGDPEAPGTTSTIIGDKFGSPDGLYVAPSGRLWIQTDVSGSTIDLGAYAGFGNNQMLCADPHTREVRRFLVGPTDRRDHGRLRDAGRARAVRRHPAPGRGARRRERSH